MKLQLFHTDAFTESVFGGNPAAVCPLEKWLPDDLLQKIAAENYLPETAFFIPAGKKNEFHLRWFSPDIEMDLCGHATLATAHILFNHLGIQENDIVFHSQSGDLKVSRKNKLLTLDFPARVPEPAVLPDIILDALGYEPELTLKARDYVLVYESEDMIRKIQPDKSTLDQINLDPGGVVITAPGRQVDFVSRFFSPQASIMEDPVTGSAHCSLIPYWSEVLNKKELTALQLSSRIGKLYCSYKGDRVLISGHAKTYLEGNITI